MAPPDCNSETYAQGNATAVASVLAAALASNNAGGHASATAAAIANAFAAGGAESSAFAAASAQAIATGGCGSIASALARECTEIHQESRHTEISVQNVRLRLQALSCVFDPSLHSAMSNM